MVSSDTPDEQRPPERAELATNLDPENELNVPDPNTVNIGDGSVRFRRARGGGASANIEIASRRRTEALAAMRAANANVPRVAGADIPGAVPAARRRRFLGRRPRVGDDGGSGGSGGSSSEAPAARRRRRTEGGSGSDINDILPFILVQQLQQQHGGQQGVQQQGLLLHPVQPFPSQLTYPNVLQNYTF